MKAIDIIRQLLLKLPEKTNLFSEEISVVSMTMSGTTVTVTTSAPHGLIIGDVFHISGALAPNPIISLTRTGDIVAAITSTSHDLTEGWPDGDKTTIDVDGATQSEYNGDKKLLTVPKRTKFTYEVTGNPATPATGLPELLELFEDGYNSLHTVISAPTTTTLNYTSPFTLNSPAKGTILLRKAFRVSGTVTPDRAIDSYTKQNTDKLWAFVVLEDSVVSKDRNTASDADASIGAGTDPRQRVLQNFSIYILATATNEIAARKLRDDMEDVNVFLSGSLLGFSAPSGFNECPFSKIAFLSHSLAFYNKGVLAQRFQYQSLFDITFNDGIRPIKTRAFRDINFKFIDPLVSDGDDVIMESDINLDDEL